MTTTTPYFAESAVSATSARSALSWAAIIAGSVVAAGVSLILLALGSGLGLASVSPWPGAGASVGAFTILAGIWLIVIQWAASAVGGYITGRLRTRWIDVHDHEVFFRDTAHGFVMWALSTIVVAGLVVSAGIGAAKATAKAAEAPYAYEVETLFRSGTAGDTALAQAEVNRIIARGLADGEVSAADRAYVRDLVAARTGLTPAAAQARVDSTVTTIRAAADDARKSASATALFTALSLLIGAFIASVAAALGGALRDDRPALIPA